MPVAGQPTRQRRRLSSNSIFQMEPLPGRCPVPKQHTIFHLKDGVTFHRP